MTKRVISLLLVLMMAFSILPVSALAEDSTDVYTYDVGDTKYGIEKVSVTGNTALNLDAADYDFLYSDGFFAGDPLGDYNPQLSSLSMTFAQISGNGYDEIALVLARLGFEIVKANDVMTDDKYTDTTSYNQIGYVFAKKDMKDINGDPTGKTLFLILPASYNYKYEWISNLLVGATGDSEGFSKTAATVLADLKTTLGETDTSNMVFWVTGHSRGASVSNLLAKQMVDDSSGKFKNTQIFAYCFASCYTADNAEAKAENANVAHTYDCIWNIINDRDPVTVAYPTGLNFTRYGRTHKILENGSLTTEAKLVLSKLYPSFTTKEDFITAYLAVDLDFLQGWSGMNSIAKGSKLVWYSGTITKVVTALTGDKSLDEKKAAIVTEDKTPLVSASQYLQDLSGYLTTWAVPNRDAYATTSYTATAHSSTGGYTVTLDSEECSSTLQTAITDCLKIFTDMDEEDSDRLKWLGDCAGTIVDAMGLNDFDLSDLSTVDTILSLAGDILYWYDSSVSVARKQEDIQQVWDWLKACKKDVNGDQKNETIADILTPTEYATLRRDLPAVLDLAFTLISKDYNEQYSGTYTNRASIIATLANNVYHAYDEEKNKIVLYDISLGAPHCQEFYIAATQSEDDLYVQGEGESSTYNLQYSVNLNVTLGGKTVECYAPGVQKFLICTYGNSGRLLSLEMVDAEAGKINKLTAEVKGDTTVKIIALDGSWTPLIEPIQATASGT